MDSDDPWARRLAAIVDLSIDRLMGHKNIGLLLDEWADDVDSSNEAIKYAEDETQEVRDELARLTVTYKALKYDRDPTFQEVEINQLKARLLTSDEERNKAASQHSNVSRELSKLQKEYDELVSKYNTWKVISG